jgi:hypothetical protein
MTFIRIVNGFDGALEITGMRLYGMLDEIFLQFNEKKRKVAINSAYLRKYRAAVIS